MGRLAPDSLSYSPTGSTFAACINIIIKYRYKWENLYNSMLLDGEYDPLDNVNEIFDETHNRKPNIVKSSNSKSTYGSIDDETTNNYGENNITSVVNSGARNDTHSNITNTVINDSIQTNSVSPEDVVTAFVNQTQTSTESSTSPVINNITDITGKQKIENSTINSQHADSLTRSISEHSDTNTSESYEGGQELTTITRRRHGNIGVTTNGQLIEDYRKIHYFNLVEIVANDIVNEIFDLNWCY